MRILGIDTSTKYASIAVLEDEELIAQSSLKFMASHSEKLLPEIVHILEIMKIPIESIDYYAVTVGPGSFTGLRVGISTVKGLCFVTGKKVIPVSTLEAIAMAFPFVNCPICPVLDARKKEVYSALFRWKDQKLIRIRDDSVLTLDKLKDWITEPTLFVGDWLNLYVEKLREAFGNKILEAKKIHSIPSAGLVALIGREKALEGNVISGRDLQPKYLRKSEAEIKFG